MFSNFGRNTDKLKHQKSKFFHKINLIRKSREVQKIGYTRGLQLKIFDTDKTVMPNPQKNFKIFGTVEIVGKTIYAKPEYPSPKKPEQKFT